MTLPLISRAVHILLTVLCILIFIFWGGSVLCTVASYLQGCRFDSHLLCLWSLESCEWYIIISWIQKRCAGLVSTVFVCLWPVVDWRPMHVIPFALASCFWDLLQSPRCILYAAMKPSSFFLYTHMAKLHYCCLCSVWYGGIPGLQGSCKRRES